MAESSDYERIEREISNEDNPVGIDVKKTHVYIIHLLRGIERRLKALEERD